MKATVVRNGSHQGVSFSEVTEIKADGTRGPITYSVPGEFLVGTELDITVVNLKERDEAEAADKAAKVKAAKEK